MSVGPICFTQPLTSDHLFFNQTKLRGGFPFTRTPRNNGAQILGMADGSVVVQLPFYRLAEALNAAYYEWQFQYQADFDDEYSLIEDLRAFGRPFLFVDHITCHEAFLAREGQTAFTLKRSRASQVITTFNSIEFLDRVFLNGVEQTEVGSSPPGAGEYYWTTESAIEFPALTQGDEIMIRYYPAYKCILANPDHSLGQFDDLRRTLRIIETQHQAVS